MKTKELRRLIEQCEKIAPEQRNPINRAIWSELTKELHRREKRIVWELFIPIWGLCMPAERIDEAFMHIGKAKGIIFIIWQGVSCFVLLGLLAQLFN